MAIEIKPPKKYEGERKFSIFLGGSIDQGAAWNWQEYIKKALENYDVLIYNPRRDDWDKDWQQSIDNPQFLGQVTWEQYHLAKADFRIFVFTKESKAPITFMELGQHIKDPGVVCAERGFYRLANIEITAKLNGMSFYDNLDSLINHVKAVIAEKQWGQ